MGENLPCVRLQPRSQIVLQVFGGHQKAVSKGDSPLAGRADVWSEAH